MAWLEVSHLRMLWRHRLARLARSSRVRPARARPARNKLPVSRGIICMGGHSHEGVEKFNMTNPILDTVWTRNRGLEAYRKKGPVLLNNLSCPARGTVAYNLVCRLLLEKKKKNQRNTTS